MLGFIQTAAKASTGTTVALAVAVILFALGALVQLSEDRRPFSLLFISLAGVALSMAFLLK